MGSDFRARRGLRALVVTTVMSVALLGASTTTSGAASLTNHQSAQQGAQWLANQIKHNGGFLENSGKPDYVDTAYAVIGLRAAGVDKGASDKAVSYLKTKIGTEVQLGGHESPGALAEYIMAAVADKQDARHFGGTAAKNNLVDRLLATARTTGPDAGLFGASDPTFDGALRQGLALAALAVVHVSKTDPRVTAGIAWLTRQQCNDGLWEAYRTNPVIPCVPANPSTFTGPDTNSSAFAIEGLAAWGRFPRQNLVLGTLTAIQSSDAGFPFVAAKNQASDPDSTALVIQALVAEQSSPNLNRWKKAGHTAYTALESFQIGCTSPDLGAFFFPGSTTANVFATVQAVPAMTGKKLPVGSSTASVILPLKPC